MTGNLLWNNILRLGLVAWLYSGKLLLTLIHALYWDLELPFAQMAYTKAIHSLKTITGLKLALSRHFIYRNDPLGGLWDFYYLPHITWVLNRGDCDDFAWMAANALSLQGVQTAMTTFIPHKITESHVIVMYQHKEGWSWAEIGFWHDEKHPSQRDTIKNAASSLGGIRAAYSQKFALHKRQKRWDTND